MLATTTCAPANSSERALAQSSPAHLSLAVVAVAVAAAQHRQQVGPCGCTAASTGAVRADGGARCGLLCFGVSSERPNMNFD